MAVPVDLRADGVLWLINRTVFHPRGFALAYDEDTGGFALIGDGSEEWHYAHDGEVAPELVVDEQAAFEAVEALLNRARGAAE